MADFWIPDESSGEIITAPQLEAEPVRHAVERWQILKRVNLILKRRKR